MQLDLAPIKKRQGLIIKPKNEIKNVLLGFVRDTPNVRFYKVKGENVAS